MVDELVSRDPDQPRNGHQRWVRSSERRDRGHERLRGQVLGIDNAAAARQQIAVDLGQCCAVGRFVDT
jgi:hypothetical protein